MPTRNVKPVGVKLRTPKGSGHYRSFLTRAIFRPRSTYLLDRVTHQEGDIISPRKSISTPQLKVLLMRSGQHCAFTGCTAQLFEEADHPQDQDTVVSEIAHILAASPGGARYDSSQNDDERADIANLIVLCDRHHKVVDAQRAKYTSEILREMKANHEDTVSRGQLYAMNAVGFAELEAVCSSLRLSPSVISTGIETLVLPPGVSEKMAANDLGETSEALIKTGLAKTTAVEAFISFSERGVPGFSTRLQQWFKAKYAEGVLASLSGDDLFAFMCSAALDNAGVNRNELLEAAAIAVVVHLFEICEIFEAVRAAS